MNFDTLIKTVNKESLSNFIKSLHQKAINIISLVPFTEKVFNDKVKLSRIEPGVNDKVLDLREYGVFYYKWKAYIDCIHYGTVIDSTNTSLKPNTKLTPSCIETYIIMDYIKDYLSQEDINIINKFKDAVNYNMVRISEIIDEVNRMHDVCDDLIKNVNNYVLISAYIKKIQF